MSEDIHLEQKEGDSQGTSLDGDSSVKAEASPMPVSTSADIMVLEYNQLFKEIRNIHDKKIVLWKIICSLIAGLIAYIFAGIILYVKSQVGASVYTIPKFMGWAYGTLGMGFTLCVYMIVHNMYYHLGPSKLHTVRYWKAINALRTGFKTLFPDISSFLENLRDAL